MSEVLIRHNPPWIGVPERFPYLDWPTAREWAETLVAEFARSFGEAGPGEAEALVDYLVTVAETRESRGASRAFMWIDGWTSPSYLADAVLIPLDLSADLTLDQLAGSADPDAVERPMIAPFESESGLPGVVSERYLNPAGADGLLARADYVFPVPDGHLRLYTAQYDLVRFDKALPKLAELASTVAVE